MSKLNASGWTKLATYGRLQVLLAARLKSTPSPETQAIHLSLRI